MNKINKIINHIKKENYGSAFKEIAKPIAKTIDSTLGTDLENCEGCNKREKDWNRGKSPEQLFAEVYPYHKFPDITDDELDTLHWFLYERDRPFEVGTTDQQKMIPIYNKIFKTKKEITSCGKCIKNMIAELEVAYKALRNE